MIRKNKIKSAIMEFPNGRLFGNPVPVTRYINLPMAWEDVLDETHGTAKIVFTEMRQSDFDKYGVRIDQPFTVNTPIEITFEDQQTVIRMIVARDTAEMIRKDGYATWSHNVELVAEIKRAEQEAVDNLTFKNPVTREYDKYSELEWSYHGNLDSIDTNGFFPPKIKQILKRKRYKLSFNQSKFKRSHDYMIGADCSIKALTVIITKPNGVELKFGAELLPLSSEADDYYTDTEFEFHVNMDGEYKIQYVLEWVHTYGFESGETCYTIYCTGYFSTIAKPSKYKAYTLKDVIQRTLDLTPTRVAGGFNKYKFRKEDLEKYAGVEAPEFTFTGKHLFEVMYDIASYDKAFPAMHRNEFYFRPYFNGVMLSSKDLPICEKALLNSAIDQYCTALDSYVENMVCINDTNVGTVVEPYMDGYISARSGGGSEISETTAVIPTLSPIYQPTEIYVGEAYTDKGVSDDIGDIQTFLMEQEDYEAMSDTSGAYPYSKAYALKYTRFEKNVTELAHRIRGDSAIHDAFIKPALANIVKSVNDDVSAGEDLRDWISSFVGDDKKVAPFSEMLFRPTYIPVVNARVRQYKPMYNAADYEATFFYNQQAEVVDSEAFGEHLKGFVQKLGNHTEIRVYKFDRIDDVPTVGTLIDGKSVYDVAMTIYETHVQVTLCLVDYAELSTYIGVKNEIKTSDISTTKWCKRYINWEEFLVFTHDENMVGTARSFPPKDLATETLTELVSFTKSEPLTCAMFTTYTEGESENVTGAEIVTMYAPIKHLAIGNSIYFQFETLDNFAVGYQSEEAPEGATNAWTATKYNRAQKAVRYCDTLGRLETVDFALYKQGPTPANSVWEFEQDELEYVPNADPTYDGEWKLPSDKTGIVKSIKFSDNKDHITSIEFVLTEKPSCPIRVKFRGKNDDGTYSNYSMIIPTSKWEGCYSEGKWYYAMTNTELVSVEAYTGTSEKLDIDGCFFVRSQLAHKYPERPSEVKHKFEPYVSLENLLVKKNSAEALSFAVQYHFRQTWKNFMIGSGMSNFCSLIGGSCASLRLFVSTKPINRFERHVNMSDTTIVELSELPDFEVEASKKRVKITLPEAINGSFESGTVCAWGLVGLDKNGNNQLIFGENRTDTKPFKRTLYLVPMKKKDIL